MKYHVEKSTVINAPLSKVRPLIENFEKWDSWSPWKIVEPDCPTTIDGTPGESGHSMNWDGQIIGSGKNTLKNNSPSALSYDLAFFKPFKSQAATSFQFEELGEQTKVTWTMDSSMPFFLFFMVKTMKNWIGMDYDRGLRMLKEISEKGNVQAKTATKGTVDYKGFSYVGIQTSCGFDEMPKHMKADFERIVKDVVMDRKKGATHWVCLYPKFDMKNMKVTYIAAISDEDLKGEDLGPDYVKGSVPNTRALEITHDGSYEFLGNAWSMAMMYMRAKKFKANGHPFEQYWNSPMEVKPEELKTSIFMPIK